MKRPIFIAAAAVALYCTTASYAFADSHVVAPGETLSSIARSAHTNVAALARLNHLTAAEENSLAVGQKIDLAAAPPAGDAAAGASAPATVAAEQRSPVTVAAAAVVEPRIQSNPSLEADLAMWSGASKDETAAVRTLAGSIAARTAALAQRITVRALAFIGTPYVFGGEQPGGFDCSGYIQYVFRSMGVSVPRTADAQFYAGRPTRGGMRPGDLVFFQTYLPGPSHVGIYLGDGKFVHASSHGVMVSRLSQSYWASRYLGAKRLLPTT